MIAFINQNGRKVVYEVPKQDEQQLRREARRKAKELRENMLAARITTMCFMERK